MNKLVIAGCGLLGTSVALASRAANPKALILGIEPDEHARREAAELGVYSTLVATPEAAAQHLTDSAAGTAVTGVAATPPVFLAPTMLKLAGFCDLVVDVGSIKVPVVEALEAGIANEPEESAVAAAAIVPCHPMAGSHQQGPAAGVADLLTGRWVFVVPMATSAASAIQAAHQFWQQLGARTVEIAAPEHDSAVAYTSHLPHLLASAYMGLESPLPAAAGTGFMEFTRLAKANPEMWSQVLSTNQVAWRPLLARFISELQALDSLIADSAAGDTGKVLGWLADRKAEREAIEASIVTHPIASNPAMPQNKPMPSAPADTPDSAIAPALAPVIAIDGPSGSGKGTLARALARTLGWHLLDSGSLYRIVGWAAGSRGIPLDDEEALRTLTLSLEIRFDGSETWVNGEGAEQHIRTEEAGTAASQVAALPAVRTALDAVQKSMQKAPGLVADGRDMGTVVFPGAALKIFLEASAEVRAERRYKQLKDKGSPASLRALLSAIEDRDERDKRRAVSPLVPAEDAVILDSTTMTIAAVIDRALELARQRGLVTPD